MAANLLSDLSNDIGQILSNGDYYDVIIQLGKGKTSFDYIQSYLIGNHAEYLRNEPVEIFRIVFEYETFENFRDSCLKTFCESPKILFESPKFSSLEKDLVINFLRKDELEMEEF
ncbi:15032_t:CDS:2 [Funneliformis geosporum]|nr:15032_t:CDS:2 [Funneliformis geosporum]